MRIEAAPKNRAGELALEIYRQTLEFIRGDQLVQSKVWVEEAELNIDDLVFNLGDFDRMIVAGAGKASVSLAKGIEEALGNDIHDGLIVTKHSHGELLQRCRIIEAGHPIPDAHSLRAGEAMLALAKSVTERDLVIFLLSGGASALLEAPVEGVTLEDLQAVNQALLDSGATIMTMNAVRSRLSKIKAGGLAKAFEKATTVVLYMSDVEGDRINVIGSGPFVPPKTFPDLSEVLKSFQLDTRFSPHILKLLGNNPASDDTRVRPPHRMVGNARLMGDYAKEVAKSLDLRAMMWNNMAGEAREFPAFLQQKDLLPKKRQEGRHDCLICVGETVVHKNGGGLGGRAQEMACALAGILDGEAGVAAIAAGSDGTDGPTDAAGALIDGGTVIRAAENGFSLERALEENDSYHFHEAARSLIKTGPTGSNLNDILIVVRG